MLSDEKLASHRHYITSPMWDAPPFAQELLDHIDWLTEALAAEQKLADEQWSLLAEALRSYVWLDKPSSTCLWCFDVMEFDEHGNGILRHKDNCLKARIVDIGKRHRAARSQPDSQQPTDSHTPATHC